MTKIDLWAIERTRRNFVLPPGVADAMSVSCVAVEDTRRDYTFDALAARQTLARMRTRHRMMLRAQYR
jgi:hypothetical protein